MQAQSSDADEDWAQKIECAELSEPSLLTYTMCGYR